MLEDCLNSHVGYKLRSKYDNPIIGELLEVQCDFEAGTPLLNHRILYVTDSKIVFESLDLWAP